MVSSSDAVPRSLRRWFIVHCVADVIAAVPLFVAPIRVLSWFGWTAVDPIATRLVAAALFGIGIESYLGRNAGPEALRGLLNLKLVWSATAALGALWSQLDGGPTAGWGVVVIFAVFHFIWLRYRLVLRLPDGNRHPGTANR